MIARLDSTSRSFEDDLRDLASLPVDDMRRISADVRDIVASVRDRGDEALLEMTRRFDGMSVADVTELEVPRERQEQALERIEPIVRDALKTSVDRVRAYHQKQKEACGGGLDWDFRDQYGNRLGQIVRGMERVGVYAPGGTAAYPSTVLMTVIPARVADVEEIILAVPTPNGEINETVLAAACLCGVDRVFTVGGAQAIAAMAYGTECIPRVDKIVGPGSIYVATAKEMVFGDVGIDMIAGPSEVVIVADASANPRWLVMDMFAQAEHDEMAQAILISADSRLLDEVSELIDQKLDDMPRRDIIGRSFADRGALIKVGSTDEAAAIVNTMAPEHLELALADTDSVLPKIRHAGAIFIGHHSAEVIGDYTAGPSHVLPTNGTARFGSPLGVYDFQVRSSIVESSPRGSVFLSRDAAIIAREEGLLAHAEAATCRVQG